MNEKSRIYVSLPITGYNIEERKEFANGIKKDLQKQCDKIEIVTPFDLAPEEGKPYSYYMGKCIEGLLECDAIFMSIGWQRSKGCMAEFQIASLYGKTILIG